MNPDQIPDAVEQAADDAAYCAAYVDAVHLGPSSAIDYIRGMAADYDKHARELDAAARMHRSDKRYDMARDAEHAATLARFKRDAYDDAMRVLDIAADSAHRIADRARDDRRAATVLGTAR